MTGTCKSLLSAVVNIISVVYSIYMLYCIRLPCFKYPGNSSLCLNFVHLLILAQKTNLEKKIIIFTCLNPVLLASGFGHCAKTISIGLYLNRAVVWVLLTS